MLLRLLIFLLTLALLVLAGAMLLPANVHVERNITIERPPSVIYGLLNDFRHFQAWSPWAERDPNARYDYSGPERGVGARVAWDGDPRQVGTGWQEIRESQPYSMIRTHLDFGPQGKADAYYDIRPVGQATRVEWGFDTDVTQDRGFFDAVFGKYMGLLLDRWIGADYEEGLNRLKQYAESFPDADFADLDVAVVESQAIPILFISTSSGQSDEAVANALGAAYGQISRFMASRGLEHAGNPISISHSWDENSYEFDAAIPVDDATVTATSPIQVGYTPAGLALRAVHIGPYSELSSTYNQAAAYIAVHRLDHSGVSWEHYISDPGDTAEEELVTHIYFMLDSDPGMENPGG